MQRLVYVTPVLAVACVLCFAEPSGTHAAEAAHPVTTVPVPDHGQPACAKMDRDGVIHLLYNTADGPRYVKSTDNGKTFSNPITVVDKASRKPQLEFLAWDMAIGKGGRVHVAMSTNAWKLKLPEEE